MPALAIAALTFVAALASGMAGFARTRTPPPGEDGSRAMLAGIAALTGLLLAATLGLSLRDAHEIAQGEQAAIRRLAAEALLFDLAARRLGPPAAEARRKLAAELALAQTEIRDGSAAGGAPGAVAAEIAAIAAALDGFKPADEAGLLAQAEAMRRYAAVGEARLALALAPADPASWPLVTAAMAWSCVTFWGLGALSRANATTIAALALGGAAVASAIWLSLALGQPLSGPFRLSAAPIAQILVEIAQ